MVNQFTLRKSSISNIQQQIDNYQAVGQTGNLAIRQSGNPAGWQTVALNFFFVIITFSIVAITPFQTLKAQVTCSTKCDGDTECTGHIGITAKDYECDALKVYSDSIKTATEYKEGLERASAYQRCLDATEATEGCETLRANVRSAQADVRNAISQLAQEKSRIQQRQDRDQEKDESECKQEKRNVNQVGQNLPPGCLRRKEPCLTQREQCRDVRQRLGSTGLTRLASGVLGIDPGLQADLGRECPQAAAAKYDNDNEKLREITDDFGESQQEVFDLEEQLREGVTKMQSDRLALETAIQNSRNEMARSTADFDARVREMSDDLSGKAGGLSAAAVGINKQIRDKLTELDKIKSKDNEELDVAKIQYQEAINAIFSGCEAKAKEAIELLRITIRAQKASGKAAEKVEDATQQNTLDRLRDTAIRAYARCRNSSDTFIELQRAKTQYQLVERALDRKEQEILDEIVSLREQHKTIGDQAGGISESANQAYLALEKEHFDNLEILTQEMQLKNFEQQGLSASFNEEQGRFQQRLLREASHATELNGEMVALTQVVDSSSLNSAFGNLDYEDYRRFDEYDLSFQNAKEVCCVPSVIGQRSRLCGSISSKAYLQSGGVR